MRAAVLVVRLRANQFNVNIFRNPDEAQIRIER